MHKMCVSRYFCLPALCQVLLPLAMFPLKQVYQQNLFNLSQICKSLIPKFQFYRFKTLNYLLYKLEIHVNNSTMSLHSVLLPAFGLRKTDIWQSWEE